MCPGWLVLALLSVLSPGTQAFYSQLAKCFEDPQYEELLQLARDGLGQTVERKRVVVIGAGMAGLTAAKMLQDAGHQVTVLEASGRIGGRIETHRVPGADWYVELGAMRIPATHRLSREFVRKFGLELNKFCHSDLRTWVLVNRVRSRTEETNTDPSLLSYTVRANEEGKSAEQLFDQSLRKWIPLALVIGFSQKTSVTIKTIRVVEELKTSSCSKVLEKYDSFSTKEYLIKVGNLSRGAVQMIGDLLNADAGYYEAFTETLQTVISFNQEPRFDEIVGGFDQLPRALHDALLPGTVQLHSPAEEVETSGGLVHVTYQTSDPLRPRERLTADYVIVATTAKAARLLHFQPPLSREKEDALRSVHYNSATKVILACTQRFWEEDGIFGCKSITDRPSRFIYYPNHVFSNGTGVILASYTLHDDSSFFTALNHARVVEVVLNDLAAVHDRSKEEIRALCPYSKVKQWNQDPYSMGAFVSFTPYQYVDYAKELCRPEGPVYFAGEHTTLPHGWIDTAIKSGIRAALSIQEAVGLGWGLTKSPRDQKKHHSKSEL
ncbi:PREDICTED: L-amino-acid oxidase-like [Chrysochloris asiatica]|uniref:Amine oxidase n=1 Tax=Chrysochloris asiatica TaxID=185453 RepID=A0A9B0WY95_CHRAS|nr:PREDICTED: L-amino-acid oxidase-like [Chrysochloris asiatica]